MKRGSWAMALGVTIAALVGCGGNLSNADIEFYYAMPDKTELKTKVPESASSQAGLLESRQGLQGPRSHALQTLGETSEFYVATRKASDDWNNGVDNLLAQLELLRNLPPTHRTRDGRSWGPFPLADHPGYLFQFVMERVENQYGYRFQVTRDELPLEYEDVLIGNFDANAGIEKGSGQMAYTSDGLKALGVPLDPGAAAINSIVLEYSTRTFPIRLSLAIDSNDPLLVPDVGYQYRGDADGGGAFLFAGEQQLDTGTNRLVIVSHWQADGSGQGAGVVSAGPNLNAFEADCWAASPDFQLTYQARSFEGAIGDQGSCVFGDPYNQPPQF